MVGIGFVVEPPGLRAQIRQPPPDGAHPDEDPVEPRDEPLAKEDSCRSTRALRQRGHNTPSLPEVIDWSF